MARLSKPARGLPTGIAASLGRLIARWSYLEWLLAQVLYRMCGVGPKIGRVAMPPPRESDYPARLQQVASILKLDLSPFPWKDYEKTLREANDAGEGTKADELKKQADEELAAAAGFFTKGLEKFPDRIEFYIYAARIEMNRKNETEALAIIESAPALNGDGQLARGRLYDRLGRYDDAWRDFVEGKAKLAAQGGGLTYQTEAVEAFFGRLARFFVKANLEHLPRASVRPDVPQPIFVMGFPRSGTTLIEQVLASHPSVRAGGELAFAAELRRLANHLFPGPEPFPVNLAQAFTADHRYAATVFRDYYFARAEAAGLLEPGKSWFVDKMPFNEVWLPLIAMAFPHAKVVRVVRHPLDVCVSVMSNNLTHGFNCGFRIEDTVHHLAAVFDLVEHYRRELGNGEHLLRYESFVANQEDETRRLLAYVGLPFDERCLQFHENRRHARTPSYAQVSEPLNDRSIGRHRHYARQLAPFLPRLAPIMGAYEHHV